MKEGQDGIHQARMESAVVLYNEIHGTKARERPGGKGLLLPPLQLVVMDSEKEGDPEVKARTCLSKKRRF